MTDPKQIAASLSEAQKRALLHENAGGTAYAWASISTLESMWKRGLLDRFIYSTPHLITWPLTPLGLAVRDILKEQSGVE